MSIFLMCTLSACDKKEKQEKEYRLQAVGFMQSGDYDAAIAYFDKALALNEGRTGELEIDMLRYRGEAELRTERYANAADTYKLLITYDEEKPEYLDLYALSLIRSGGSLKDARNAYFRADEAEKKTSFHDDVLNELGTALVVSGDREDKEAAIALYKEVLDRNAPQASELYNRLGMLCFEDGDYAKAQEYFELGLMCISIETLPETEKSLQFNLAVCYEYNQDFEKAISLFKKYIDKYGEDADARHEIIFMESELRSSSEQ